MEIATQRDPPECPACGSATYRVLFRVARPEDAGDYEIASCEGCKLVRTLPVPPSTDLSKLYSMDYFRRILESPETQAHEIQRFRKLFTLISADLSGRKLLSVGCGLGFDLRVAKAMGLDAEGVEVSPGAREYAASTSGAPVHLGSLESLDLKPKSYDIITFWDVLEHVVNPRSTLGRAVLLLGPGGTIVVRAPNIDGLFSKVSYVLSPLSGEWRHPEPPAHLFDFSDKTIVRLAEGCGLRPKRIIFDEYPRIQLIAGSRRPRVTRALSAAVYPLARILRKGNSMIVLFGKKREAP